MINLQNEPAPYNPAVVATQTQQHHNNNNNHIHSQYNSSNSQYNTQAPQQQVVYVQPQVQQRVPMHNPKHMPRGPTTQFVDNVNKLYKRKQDWKMDVEHG